MNVNRIEINEISNAKYNTAGPKIGYYVRYDYRTPNGRFEWDTEVTGSMGKREAFKLAERIASYDDVANVAVQRYDRVYGTELGGYMFVECKRVHVA